MKTTFLQCCIVSLLSIAVNPLIGQVANEYFFGKPYAFPVESTLTEIDSIEKVRNAYRGINDSLFLENTIYKFERLAFLPDQLRSEFDYVAFYEELINIDVHALELAVNNSPSDPLNDLPLTFYRAKSEVYERLSKYFVNQNKFEKARRCLDLSRLNHRSVGNGCISQSPQILKEHLFRVYLNTEDVVEFVKMYQPYFWNYFINPDSTNFADRAIPFIQQVKLAYNQEERAGILEKALNSIDCHSASRYCCLQLFYTDIYINTYRVPNLKTNDLKGKKENAAKDFF